MEVLSRASIAMVAAICLVLAAAFPAAMGNVDVPAAAPAPSSDGTAIDQGIAYVLMLVALVLTYIIH